MLVSFKAKSPKARARKQERDSTLNQALVALSAGDFEKAASLAQHVLDGKKPSTEAQIRAKLVLIQTQSRQGRFTNLYDQAEALFHQVPESQPALQALVGNEIIFICQRSGNLGLGASRGEEMLRLYGESWPGVDLIELLCQLSSCHFFRGDASRAHELSLRALEIAEKVDSPKGRAQSLWQSSALASFGGDLKLGLEQAEEAAHWARFAGLQKIVSAQKNTAAVIMLQLPNQDPALIRRLGEEAYLEAIAHNHADGAAYACEILSEVALRAGDYEAALAHAKTGLRVLPSEVAGPKASLLVQVAKILARTGKHEEAEDDLLRATTYLESQEPSRELAMQWGDIARVFVEVGLSDKGVYAYEKAIQISGLLREEQETYIDR